MAFRPMARSPYRIAPGRSRGLRGRGCDTESAEQYPFPATGIRLIAISESVLSDSRDLRRHFRVVPAPERWSVRLRGARVSASRVSRLILKNSIMR
jgi:hypothetical protein